MMLVIMMVMMMMLIAITFMERNLTMHIVSHQLCYVSLR